MKVEKRNEMTVTFGLKERNLLAFLRKDESVPWGISDGRAVAAGLEKELESFVKGQE
jgi:hypothetical protein